MQERENAAILLDYCDRKLDADMMQRISRHVELCPECQRSLSAQRLVWEALDAWQPAPVSLEFNRRLYARIEEENSAGFWQRVAAALAPFPMRPAVPVAAACLVIVAALLFQGPRELSPQQQVSVESIDLDQVERTLDDMEMLRQMGVTMPTEGANPQSL